MTTGLAIPAFSIKNAVILHKSANLSYNVNDIFWIKLADGTEKEYTKAQSTAECCPGCFFLYGFSGASLDEIAQLANMHKSNIFYYYENKESLYVEVLTTVMQKWLAPLQILEVELEPTEALTHYLMQKIESSKDQPKASRLFALEIIQGAPHILPILKGPLKKLFKRKTKVIETWQEQGKLSKEIDAELLIINIWAITQNYADFSTQMEMVTGKTLRNRSMYQRTIEHTVHLMLYGVLPR